MDYSQWQQPATIQPAEMSQSAVDAYYASYYAYYAPFPDPSLNPNPNTTSNLQTHESSAIAIPPPPPPGVVDAATTSYVTVDTTPYYTLDTNNAHNLAWREAVRMYGTEPLAITGAGATVQTNDTGQPHSVYPGFPWTSHIVQAQLPECVSLKKRSKKGKAVQSSYCEVCKIDCNGPSVFEQHKLGKKHLKNLEKLKTGLPSNTDSPLAGVTAAVPLIGPQENPCKRKARKSGKKGAESIEDLETKRQKVVECGAPNESIRLCRICNIVCNSDKVYNDHLAGQKHTAKAAKPPVNA